MKLLLFVNEQKKKSVLEERFFKKCHPTFSFLSLAIFLANEYQKHDKKTAVLIEIYAYFSDYCFSFKHFSLTMLNFNLFLWKLQMALLNNFHITYFENFFSLHYIFLKNYYFSRSIIFWQIIAIQYSSHVCWDKVSHFFAPFFWVQINIFFVLSWQYKKKMFDN